MVDMVEKLIHDRCTALSSDKKKFLVAHSTTEKNIQLRSRFTFKSLKIRFRLRTDLQQSFYL